MSLLLLFKGGSTAAGFRSLALELGIGASPGLSLDAGSFTVSGQDAALKRGRRLQADAGSYTLDGVAAQRDLTMVGAAGSYSLSGQAATFSYSQNAGFRSLALEIGAGAVTSATVIAEPGTYSVSGQDAGLKRGLRLVAEAGNYTYTGVAAQRDLVVTAAAGTYSVTGYDATLTTATSVSGGFFSLLLEIGGGAIVDVVQPGEGWYDYPVKRRKSRDFKRERDERDELRKQIVAAIEPVTEKTATVVTMNDKVAVVTDTGPSAFIPIPPSFDTQAVVKMVMGILEAAGIEAQRARDAQARQQARQAYELAMRELERRRLKRRREEELLLLM